MPGNELAEAVNRLFEETTSKFVDWQVMVTSLPDLKHCTPTDMRQCRDRLRDSFGLVVLDYEGVPSQVGRKAI